MDTPPKDLMTQMQISTMLSKMEFMLRALDHMGGGQFRASIVLRAPDNDAASIVVSTDTLQDLADYMDRVRDAKVETIYDARVN
jgi:hypothetical protein